MSGYYTPLYVTVTVQERTGLKRFSAVAGHIDPRGYIWIEGDKPSRPIQTPFRVKRQYDGSWYRETDA